MDYVEKFEDEGFFYELSVQEAREDIQHLFTNSQGLGYLCQWSIVEKVHHHQNQIIVTDDQCEIIIFDSVESAVKGAKDFLSI